MLIKHKTLLLFVIYLLLTALTASCSKKEDAKRNIYKCGNYSTQVSGEISTDLKSDSKQNKSTKPDGTDVSSKKPSNTSDSKTRTNLVITHTKKSDSAKTSTEKPATKKSTAQNTDTKNSSIEKTGIKKFEKKEWSKENASEQTPTQPVVQEESNVEETTSIQTFTGYIIDKDCLNDPGPEKDTIDCLLMDSCRESGYGLAIIQGNGYLWYEFDSSGKILAYDILKSTRKYKQISVTVKGTLENHVLQVSEMYENQDD